MSNAKEPIVRKLARAVGKKGFQGLQRIHDHVSLQKKFELDIERLRKNGEKPVMAYLEEASETAKGFIALTAKVHPWAKKLKDDFNVLLLNWKENGGAEYNAMKEILDEMVKNSKRPSLSFVSERVGKSSTYLLAAKPMPWQKKLRNEIEEAQKAFEKPVVVIPHGYVRLTYQCKLLEVLVKQMEWDDAEITVYKDAAAKLCGKKVHFGSWLYRSWFRVAEGSKGVATYVDPISFDIHRAPLIKSAVLILNAVPWASQGLRAREVEKYINWLNQTESATPINSKDAERSYRDFTFYLQQVVKRNDPRKKQQSVDIDSFSRKIAGNTQSAALSILAEAYSNGNKGKIQGMTGSIESGLLGNNDTVIDIDVLNNTLSYYYQFFKQITDFLLEKQSYPHAITLLEHHAILTPLYSPFPAILTYSNSGGRTDWRKYFDPDLAVLRDDADAKAVVMQSEVYQGKSQSRRQYMLERVVEMLSIFRTTIDSANRDYSHPSRLSLGMLAMQAYFMVLMDVTGMNDSTLASLPWSDEDDIIEEGSGDSVRLRNIKHRAGSKVVEFTIQRKFKGSFIDFLKLRRFVLEGYGCDTLFFIGAGKTARLEGGYRTGNYGSLTHRQLQRYYPDLQFFGSRKLRQFKKRWIMKQSNGRTYLAAKLLQHTESVSQTSYPAQSKEESQSMMGNYFDYQHSLTMEVDNSEATGSGACKSYKQPEAQVEETPIKPDCNKKMTCLFCKHYRLKPIKKEIHKVLSMKYVIEEFSKLHAWSQAHFNDATKPILDRIEMLLQAMTAKYPDTVGIIEELRKEVDKQNLTSYWQGVHERNWEATW